MFEKQHEFLSTTVISIPMKNLCPQLIPDAIHPGANDFQWIATIGGGKTVL
jgi:hypothetical protein